jgi:hypothetical protein
MAEGGPKILEYAPPKPHVPTRLGWPVALGIFQLLWIAGDAYFDFGSDMGRPKRLWHDSIFEYLIPLAPSFLAFVSAARGAAYHIWKGDFRWAFFICLLLCLLSGYLCTTGTYSWIHDLLLDSHGRWDSL